MKKIIFVFLLITGVANSLIAQSTFAQFSDSTQTWLDARVKNAKKGIREIVVMPFVVHSTGWGCTCPDYYIGTDVFSTSGLFVSAITPDAFPAVDSVGHSLIVKGYFTGKMDKIPGDDTIIYHVPFFKIISWKENKDGEDVGAPRVIK
jgi:hypothetical protein